MTGSSRLIPLLGLLLGATLAAAVLASRGALSVPASPRDWLFVVGVLAALMSLGYILSALLLAAGRGAKRGQAGDVAPLRPIAIPEAPVIKANDPADDALARLDGMVGLAPVKDEVRSLIARAKVDALRRAQGAEVAAVSQHMVFTGPPGVGKTEVARILGDVFRQMKLLRKGHLVETDRAGLVAGYVGQTAARTLDKCREALDGILFIDEAYTLAGEGNDFGREAIDTLLKFMEDNRDRIVVIVAGYAVEMGRFIDMNPGLAGRFTRHIDFPAYCAADLQDILGRMAVRQGFTLPIETTALTQEWLDRRIGAKDWANAREMRSLMERAREAQAVRISNQPDPDLSDLNSLTEDDLRVALRLR